jgi:hypothetical protein
MAEPSVFQPVARDIAQAIHLDAGKRLSELACTPNLDADIALKIYNATKDVGGAVAEKKLDPLANLPTFHITFVNGRMTGTIEAAPPVSYIEMDAETTFLTDAASPTMLVNAHINSEIIELDEEVASMTIYD